MGNSLRDARRQAGLDVVKVAEEFGVTTRTVMRWECGENEPSLTIIRRLSELYSVSVDRLINPSGRFIQGSAENSDLKTLQHRFCDLIQTIGKLNRQCDTPEEVMRLLLDVGDNGEINHPENRAFIDLLETLAPLAGEILRSIRRGERVAS